MRTLVRLTLALGATSLVLSLPTGAEARPGFSLYGGAQCDAPSVRDGESFDSTCAFQPLAGAAVSVSFSALRDFGFEAGAHYAGRSFGSDAFATDTNVRAAFLELSLLGTLPFYESESAGGLQLDGVVGAQVGVLLEAHRRFRDVDQDVKSVLRPADFKIVTALRVIHRRLFVEGGIAWGLTNLDDTNQQEIRSRAVFMKLGYVI